jgi:hypothetical protein
LAVASVDKSGLVLASGGFQFSNLYFYNCGAAEQAHGSAESAPLALVHGKQESVTPRKFRNLDRKQESVTPRKFRQKLRAYQFQLNKQTAQSSFSPRDRCLVERTHLTVLPLSPVHVPVYRPTLRAPAVPLAVLPLCYVDWAICTLFFGTQCCITP